MRNTRNTLTAMLSARSQPNTCVVPPQTRPLLAPTFGSGVLHRGFPLNDD